MRVVVVSDVLLDEDIDGVATRLSPEAPVPVVDVSSRTRRAGGAGLVATMLAQDGVDVELVTALAFDDAAFAVRDCLGGVSLVAGNARAATPVKTRLRAEGHAVARIDDACGEPPGPEVTPRMVAAIRSADAVVVADYGRGIAAHPRIRDALERRRSKPCRSAWQPPASTFGAAASPR